MKDSWGPLKALAVSSIFNFVGDVVLCSFLGYGIAGAAWATMVSQVCLIFPVDSLNYFMLCFIYLFVMSVSKMEYSFFLLRFILIYTCSRLLQLI